MPATDQDQRWSAALEQLGRDLRDAGVDTLFKYGEEGVPDQLFAALDPEVIGIQLYLQLVFYPGPDEPGILQHYVGLPFPVEEHAVPGLCRFINLVNGNLPLGHLGYLEDQGEVYLRYNAPVSGTPIATEPIRYTLTMAEFVIRTFGPLVEEVAAGLAFGDALLRLDAELALMPDS